MKRKITPQKQKTQEFKITVTFGACWGIYSTYSVQCKWSYQNKSNMCIQIVVKELSARKIIGNCGWNITKMSTF